MQISLAALLLLPLAQAPERSEATTPTVLVGRVLAPGGLPARGAEVVTSAGGKAITRADGGFEIAVEVPDDAGEVLVTAAADARRLGGSLAAEARIRIPALTPITSVGALVLAPSTDCAPRWRATFGVQPGLDEPVHALAAFDDGGGMDLYVGGDFLMAGSVATNHIARWDGVSWSALGSGVNGAVLALAVHDDGTGPALFAGGFFTTAGGVTVNRVARWDGSSWSALGSGMTGPSSPGISALAVFDDGNGPALYAGGQFTSAGGVPANRIARWDGSSWSALGSGANHDVYTLAAFDDGTGPELWAGGAFTTMGGVAANRIARWDGSSWSPAGAGMPAPVNALAVFDDGSGPSLFAGGEFRTSPAKDSYLARWGCRRNLDAR